MGYVGELIIWLAGHSQLLAHQLLWNMKANMYTDEDAKIEDPLLYRPLKEISDKIIDHLEGAARSFYQKEFELFDKITKISAIIKPYSKGAAKEGVPQSACRSQIGLHSLFTIESRVDFIIH